MKNRLSLHALTVVGVLAAVAGCLDRRDTGFEPRGKCNRCHGSSARAGSDLVQAAPPTDLSGNTDPLYTGVGAHQTHLTASATHAAVACDQCHVVPTEVASPGHAETLGPAKITFGPLASTGGRTPAWDRANLTCTDTYCHRDARPQWTSPRSSADACGTCHSLPPPPPHVSVSPSRDCVFCHGDVVDAARNIVRPDLHVNGRVDVVQLACNTCHGHDQTGAPPPDTKGSSDPTTSLGVGAHTAHLAGTAWSRPVACGDCHIVPQSPTDPSHIQGATPTVTFGGVAIAGAARPSWDRTARTCTGSWCHGLGLTVPSPEWTAQHTSFGCNACHGDPPSLPHPQFANCSACHRHVAPDNASFTDPSLHVDGVVEVSVPAQCNGCHGSASSFAPPRDLAGDTDAGAPGVGAHQTHLSGGQFSRPVQCSECHVVPKTVLDRGHIAGVYPALVVFSGVATAQNAAPTFDGSACARTYCHGGFQYQSGGTNDVPVWTVVDGSQAACGTCHGLPPPPPHPDSAKDGCPACHANVTSDLTIRDKSLHGNGQVDF